MKRCSWLALAALLNLAGGCGSPAIRAWQPFEITLQASRDYENPYADVTLDGVFDGPAGQRVKQAGFWDGGRTWRIRMAPTRAGPWRYQTHSSDPAMDGRAGEFSCAPSKSRGFVEVSDTFPGIFCWGDGTPFFWHGDTAWPALSSRASFEKGDFRRYVDFRTRQGFTVIQMAVAAVPPREPGSIGENEGGTCFIGNDPDRVNPVFFQWVDKRVAYACRRGVVPVLFLIWGNSLKRFTRGQFDRYVRYAVARYSAYNVIWSLGGGWNYPRDLKAQLSHHGRVLKEADPYDHPLSIHLQQQQSVALEFARDGWMDFIMQRTSIHGDVIHGAALNGRHFGIPVVSAAPQYEGSKGTQADQVRWNAWAVVTAGAFHTYGAVGVVDFHPARFRRAMRLPGAKQMQHLISFFRYVPWWQMEPHDELLHPIGGATGFCFADSCHYVIYGRNLGGLFANLALPRGSFLLRWYDPGTGSWIQADRVQGGRFVTLPSPKRGDAVALVIAEPETAKRLEREGVDFERVLREAQE